MGSLDTVSVAAIICLAGAVQSTVGFAYGLFATPLLIWIGLPLPNAIAIVVVCGGVQSCLGARHLRAEVPWRLALTASGLRLIWMFAGVLALEKLMSLSVSNIRFLVGCVLCVLVAIQAMGRARPAERVHWVWGGLAFTTSGLLAGVCGMGGPPLVIWALAHDWSVRKTRGFLFAVFATSLPIHVSLLYVTFGRDILRSAVLALCLTPAVILGTVIGMPIGNRMAKPVLRTVVYLILMIIGVISIVPAAVGYFR